MKILCAALRIKGTNTIIGCCRHGDGYSMLNDLRPELGISNVEEGFLTDAGDFLDRKSSFKLAVDSSQISMTTYVTKHNNHEDELYSEDLY